MKKTKREKELEAKLYEIAILGKGIRPEQIDWAKIGKIAVDKAQRQLAGNCKTCGHSKVFQSRVEK